MTSSMKSDLSPTERAQFNETGFFVREKVFEPSHCDALLDRLSEIIARAATDDDERNLTTEDLWHRMPSSAGRTRIFLDPALGEFASAPPNKREPMVCRVGHVLHLDDDMFSTTALSPSVGGIAADLLGGDACILQATVIYKQPWSQMATFEMHQDTWYVPTDPSPMLLAFVALDETTPENGCLEIIPGSHKYPSQMIQAIGPRGFETTMFPDVPKPGPEEHGVRLPIPRGSVIFMNGRCYHGSKQNRSLGPRRAYVVHLSLSDVSLPSDCWLQPPGDGFTLVP